MKVWGNIAMCEEIHASLMKIRRPKGRKGILESNRNRQLGDSKVKMEGGKKPLVPKGEEHCLRSSSNFAGTGKTKLHHTHD